MGKKKGIIHPSFGSISRHHLVPKERLKNFYGKSFFMPNNILRLWRFRHNAWHILFRQMSLNETIEYLYRKRVNAYGYKTITWKILFHELDYQEVINLLLRTRRIVRKKYEHFEFDPSAQKKSRKIQLDLRTGKVPKKTLKKSFNRA